MPIWERSNIFFIFFRGMGFFLKNEGGVKKKVLVGGTRSCYTLVRHMLGTPLSNFARNPMITSIFFVKSIFCFEVAQLWGAVGNQLTIGFGYFL